VELYFREVQKDVMVVALDGGLDDSTAPELVRQVDELVEGGIAKLIIDCEKLTHMSSAGLGAIVRLHRRAAARGGDVKIAGVKGAAANVLGITRLDRVFAMYPDVSRALLAFRERDAEGEAHEGEH